MWRVGVRSLVCGSLVTVKGVGRIFSGEGSMVGLSAVLQIPEAGGGGGLTSIFGRFNG